MASLKELTAAIPGAGRRTLLTALQELADAAFPENFRLCVLDAERLDAPAQLELLDRLAAEPAPERIFVLNKVDRLAGPRSVIARSLGLLRERGFTEPVLYPCCASAAKLLRLPTEELTPKQRNTQADYYFRYGPGENSLSAFAVTGDPSLSLGSREISFAQLRVALENTGVPALAEALSLIAQGSRKPKAEAPACRDDPLPSAPPQAEPSEELPAGSGAAVSSAADAGDAAAVPAAAPAETNPLAPLLARAETASCAELLDMARAVKSDAGTPDELREQALDQLHGAYLARETAELEALTQNAEALDLEGLRALTAQIAAGPYTVQNRAPYIAKLNARIDGLQAEDLATLCAGVEEADGRTLARIREALEQADCAEVMKTEHFRRIEARQEALDIEALDRVTAGAEQMTEKELRAVAVTLEANNWNPKYVTAYRHRVELCREAAQCREIEGELTELNDMERRELLALRERIGGRELPRRFTEMALRRVDEKIFRLDMLRLMALHNDFDNLDFDGIDSLRVQAARGDYCDRAKQLYLDRLLERENALILGNTSARAELSRQLIAKHKLRMSDFCFASPAEEYRDRLAEFWGGTGLEQPRDLPVFLFLNGSQYAMTGTRFYYKAGRQLEWLPIANIDHFQVMKQHLSLILQIVGKDSSYRLTEARISRSGAERTLDFLNDCVKHWAEPGPAGRLTAELRVRPLDAADYTAPVEPEPLRPLIAWELFCQAYDGAKLREGRLIRPGDREAQDRLPKLRQTMGLPENASLVWYESASWLGAPKEGVALGLGALYRKEGKEPVQIIPIERIDKVLPAGSKRLSVLGLQNESWSLPVSDDMAPLIADFVRTVQLGNFLDRRRTEA